MGRNLKAKGVVASVDAFTDAADANPDSTGIQVGYYPLKKEMPAADALEVLVDPANLVKNTVTIPEGLRVTDDRRAAGRQDRLPRAAVREGAAGPAAIGLPRYADGNAEGYLFPSTYDFGPKETPDDDPHDDGRRAGSRPPTTPAWRTRPQSSATRRAS